MRHINVIPFLLALLVFGSCSDFDDMNIDPNSKPVNEIDPNMYLAPMMKEVSQHANAGLHQRIHNIYIDSWANYFFGGFDPEYYTHRDDYVDLYWQEHYKWINQLNYIINEVGNTEEYSSTTQQVARIWKVYAYHRFTDFFGDIPYSEAANGTGDLPKYDRQKDIYLDMLNELKDAATKLNTSESLPAEYDFIYGGDLNKWKLFANSLRLRLAMRISRVSDTEISGVAKQHAQEAVASGVFEDNNQMATVQCAANPWGYGYNLKYYSDWGAGNGLVMTSSFYKLVVGLGGQDFPEPEFFMDGHLAGSDVNITYTDVPDKVDPRAPYYFYISDDNNQVVDEFKGRWTAVPTGRTPGSDSADPSLKNDNNPRAGKFAYESYDRRLICMPTSEVWFLRAEGAVNGWEMKASAQECYENGIRASMEQWGIDNGIVDAYIASAEPNVHGTSVSFTDNAGSNNDVMNKIITQKYISGFPDNGWESWADIRRLNLPMLDANQYINPASGVKDGEFAQRSQYPQKQKQFNPDGYKSAIDNQGADLIATKVWWAN
ncbi:SusD/RagB family nutrient-binding outer membrane lipoprotein [Marinilabiliaceae bacterium JC017]|nr:SusD/RagB family nutrient-binding outer membrane lipoprotein [Marinilabiliaceae bacterium JC017]